MKFIKFSFFFIMLLLMQYAQLKAQDKYIYPLNQEMPEWKSLRVEEKNKMLQIPEDKLKSMPTETLIRAYIDNPFCSLMFFYNTPQEGFNRIYKEFNGLRELIKRNDAAIKLTDFYKKMQIDGYDVNLEPIEKARYAIKFIYLETLLSQLEIISQLKPDEVKTLISELMKKFYEKLDYLNVYSTQGVKSCAYTIAHNLNEKRDLQNFTSDKSMQYFLETGYQLQDNMIEQILQKAKTFVQN